jgi:hypothetical protein
LRGAGPAVVDCSKLFLGEWRDLEASRRTVPRLLSLHFQLDVTSGA